MTLGDVIGRLVAALEAAGVPYMLTGSIASAYHGPSRATQDVDIVIDPSENQVRTLVSGLAPTMYYADLHTALDAKRSERMFNIIDLSTGWKVDFIIRKSRPFSRAEFDRRKQVDLMGHRVFIATAEDVVISKLEWAKLGQSLRQIEDVAGILRTQSALDRAYLGRWVRELHLDGQWRAACEAAGVSS